MDRYERGQDACVSVSPALGASLNIKKHKIFVSATVKIAMGESVETRSWSSHFNICETAWPAFHLPPAQSSRRVKAEKHNKRMIKSAFPGGLCSTKGQPVQPESFFFFLSPRLLDFTAKKDAKWEFGRDRKHEAYLT